MNPETNFICDRCGAFCHDERGKPIQHGEADIAALIALPATTSVRCIICVKNFGPWEPDPAAGFRHPSSDSQLPPSDR